MIGRFPWDPFPPGTPDPKGSDPVHGRVFRAAVTGADAYRAVRFAVRREHGILRLGNRFVPDGRYREVAFVALGHAANSMALAILAVLDERVTQGFLAGPLPVLDEIPFRGVTVPPGWGGDAAAPEVVGAVREIAGRLGESDLLILLLSPGANRALGTPPPGSSADELSALLATAHARGASGREVGVIARAVGGPAGEGLLPPTTRADVETLVVERGDGATVVGGGPTIAIRPAERTEARATLARVGLLDGLAAPVRERLAPDPSAGPVVPSTARRPVVVAGAPDALRAAADSTFDKGWTARLAALSLTERPAAAADRFLDCVETVLKGERPGAAGGAKGLAAFAMLTLDLPEGVDDSPGLAEFLGRARDGIRRREMSVGLYRTAGALPPFERAAGGVVGAVGDPTVRPDPGPWRPLAMQPGITDVGLLAAAVLARPAEPADGGSP